MKQIFRNRFRELDSHPIADGIFVFVRHVLTILLLWLRIPLMWIFSMLSVLAFFAWIFVLLFNDGSKPLHSVMTWGMFLISVGSFAVMYVYDLILGFVSPDDLIVGTY